MENGAIFPLFYLPPVEYFSKLLAHRNSVIIENAEHFCKQSYRNRASIHSANGRLDLTVPVIRGSLAHTVIRDVRISYDFNWQRLHWMSLESAYRSSAYFEFYEDKISPYFNRKWDYLFDFNEELLQTLFGLLKIDIPYSYSQEYKKAYNDRADYRDSIHPKKSPTKNNMPYFQVFESRNGFLPNLSILDLLFNQGPQSLKHL